MKNYDLMSYQELRAVLHTIQGELSRIKTSDVITKRLKERKKDLISRANTINSLLVLAKEDKKICHELSFSLTEAILRDHGVYSSGLHNDLAARLIARNVDASYKPRNKTPLELKQVRSFKAFRRWLKYKAEILIQRI